VLIGANESKIVPLTTPQMRNLDASTRDALERVWKRGGEARVILELADGTVVVSTWHQSPRGARTKHPSSAW